MKEMWNNRYAAKEYAYGTEPNVFFKEVIDKQQKTGKILFAAEGEGRNAIYAAKKGWKVTAFDSSEEGQKKALQLAEKENVSIDYQAGDFLKLPLINQKFDVAVLIYAHFHPSILSEYHKKNADLINPEGLLILEGFSKGHLEKRKENPNVGGPDKLEMLFSKELIQNDFQDFEIIQLEEVEIKLKEGLYHNGIGKVIRFIGKKI
ncbi:MAG: SAM-dependent methyltransferase [Flexibacter sp. CG_4_10_14_3_um_filter_32_15]|nr:MAG: SAM-dependent methyltransferase [Flexibacter sp. CG_4_10_14_3_um_filter_32_15]